MKHDITHIDTASRFQQASKLFAKGHTEAALAQWRSLLSADPDNMAIYHNMGIVCRRARRLAESEAVLRSGLARFPASWELWLALGYTLLEWASPARALMAFTKATEINIHGVRCHHAVAAALIAEAERLRTQRNHPIINIPVAIAHTSPEGVAAPTDTQAPPPAETTTLTEMPTRHTPPMLAPPLSLYSDAGAHLATALNLDPHDSGTHYLAAKVSLAQGRLQDALSHLELCLNNNPGFEAAENLLTTTMLRMGQWRSGLPRLARACSPRTRPSKLPRNAQGGFHTGLVQWHGEPLRQRTLLVHADELHPHYPMELGDLVFLLRFLRGIPAHKIVARLPEELVSLVRRSRMVHHIITQYDQDNPPVNPKNQEKNVPVPDVQIGLHALPSVLLTSGISEQQMITDHAPPYLSADPVLTGLWKRRIQTTFPGRIPIGLCWAAQPASDTGITPFFDPSALRPLIESIPNIQLINLQLGTSRLDLPLPIAFLEDLERDSEQGFYLHDDPLAHVLAVMQSCALVITVDGAIAHLAGAIDKTVWVLANSDSDWSFVHTQSNTGKNTTQSTASPEKAASHLNHDNSQWYPSAEVFAKTADASWQKPVERMTTTLQDIFAALEQGEESE